LNLPLSIQAYFVADGRSDGDALVRAFAPDAVVKDEGHSYAGRQAIDAWWRDVKARYQHVVEPFEMAREDDVMKVRTRVTGQFPGSPVTRTFAFRLEGERIAGLDIGE
jgi:hypothetical protein